MEREEGRVIEKKEIEGERAEEERDREGRREITVDTKSDMEGEWEGYREWRGE